MILRVIIAIGLCLGAFPTPLFHSQGYTSHFEP